LVLCETKLVVTVLSPYTQAARCSSTFHLSSASNSSGRAVRFDGV